MNQEEQMQFNEELTKAIKTLTKAAEQYHALAQDHFEPNSLDQIESALACRQDALALTAAQGILQAIIIEY